ncbi:hypothetical protein CAT7_07588 [Carnobacterium sp. AT7]|nr:hypothetical protein CAT7_07588 [Carnobacterium sp. AT7]
MKDIKINWIRYENFKGLKDYKLVLDGSNADVSAQNAVGKTTLYDGFLWLLFGKDSAERSKFKAKPFDKERNEILGKEPVVEAELMVDGQRILLKRELVEVWSKIKGRTEKERKSDKTKYYVNQVPCNTAKEFRAYIDALIDEDTFKLLTNPAAFNSLDWTKRREVLLQLVDGVTDEEVIEKNEELSGLTKILDGRSVEEQKKIISAKKRDVANSIDGMTARFDEAERAIPNTEGIDQEQLNALVATNKTKIEEGQNKIAELKNGGAITDLKNKRGQLDLKLTEEKARFFQTNQLSTETLINDINKLNIDLNEKNQAVWEKESQISNTDQTLTREIDSKGNLLRIYKAKKEETFDVHRTACKMCGQELPADQTEQMKSTFNKEKAEEVEKLLAQGKASAEKVRKLETEIKQLTNDFHSLISKRDIAKDTLDRFKEELSLTKERHGQFEDSKESKSIIAEIQKVTQSMIEEQTSTQSEIEEYNNLIRESSAAVDSARQQLSLFSQKEKQLNRIQELKDEHSNLASTYEELERQEYLTDEFTRRKVQLLEKEINAKFSMANFKLFDIQKNGGINEVCEATYGGSEYSTNLNNAARINVGLDIINTLSNHYQVSAPIFVDNAESVNELIDTQAQMISLIVSDDPVFKVEVQ